MGLESGKVLKLVPDGSPRKLPCWIESFTEATASIPSPEIFRKWCAISAIGAALERRVWVESAESVVFPNLFVLLVAPPGVGKSKAIERARDLLVATKSIKVAPDDVTKASLIDAVAAAKTVKILSPQEMLEYHSLFVAADELGVLLQSGHDLVFLNTLNVLYDNRTTYNETRRGREEPLFIDYPQLSILAGTQPEYLGATLPPEAWGMGWTARTIMVYHGHKTKPKLGLGQRRKAIDTGDLLHDLKDIADLHGPMAWTQDAEDLLTSWYDADLPPVPQHSKLKHYLPRRILHIFKLCIISAVSRGSELVIDRLDVERARDWLIEVESLMPEIFKDMAGKSDIQVIQDLHFYLWQIFSKEKRAVHKARIMMYLSERTPAYNVENIFKICIANGIIKETVPNLYEPGTTNSTGEV